MLKVTGGKYRSRVLISPSEETIPTKGRVKEALFSALHDYLEGASVLDLFAGSGALGIEALSRGASHCVFVDESPKAIETIRGNLASLKEENAKVIKGGAVEYLENCGKTFDIIFLDPPYARSDLYEKTISSIAEKNMLTNNGVLVIEFEGDKTFALDAFSKYKEYHYGRSRIIIAKK